MSYRYSQTSQTTATGTASAAAAALAAAAAAVANDDTDNEPLPATLGGLEPTGISFGDASMMSAATNMMRLEDTGTSFGTMMSVGSMVPEAVDGGLMEAVGTSFGSLSLDPHNREALFRTLEVFGGGPEIPPMFHSEEKATGNLLECSDTESEDSEDRQKLTVQKSQAWERMKSQLATGTNLTPQGRTASTESNDLMPPPAGIPSHHRYHQHHEPPLQQQYQQQLSPSQHSNLVDAEVAIPTTALENNFSTLSVWSAADDFDPGDLEGAGVGALEGDVALAPPPPEPLRKEDSW
jgi:hypothetical protein